MFAGAGVEADRGVGLLLGGLVVLAFASGGVSRPWLVPLALSLAVAGCLAMGLRRAAGPGPDWSGTALTLLGICYCAWLLGHVIWLRALPGGRHLVLFALAVTWCGETAAYFVGRRWGRHKLAPRVSPGKTMEGGVALLLGREDFGLFEEELARCDLLVTIPASREYPILNLSHAAAILLYELALVRYETRRR